MALTSKIQLAIAGQQRTELDLGQAFASLSQVYRASYSSGVGAGQADVIFHDRRTLAASAGEDLDLSGTLVGPLGESAAFTKVKALVIVASAANTGNLVIGAAASSPWSSLLGSAGTVTLRPGATFAVYTGEADAVGYEVAAG